VEQSLKHLNRDSIQQYQTEERTLIAFRLASSRYRIKELLDIMKGDELSSPQKTIQLASELDEYYGIGQFGRCRSMGELVKCHLKQTLRKNLKSVPKMNSRED
jgi:hypothetical protein